MEKDVKKCGKENTPETVKQAEYPIFGNPHAGNFGLRSHNLDSKRPRISTSISLVSLELS